MKLFNDDDYDALADYEGMKTIGDGEDYSPSYEPKKRFSQGNMNDYDSLEWYEGMKHFKD